MVVYNEFNRFVIIFRNIKSIKIYISHIVYRNQQQYLSQIEISKKAILDLLDNILEAFYIRKNFDDYDITSFKMHVLEYINTNFNKSIDKKSLLLFLIDKIIMKLIDIFIKHKEILSTYITEKIEIINKQENQTENKKKLVSRISNNFDMETKRIKRLIQKFNLKYKNDKL
jgi:hypothetical protein